MRVTTCRYCPQRIVWLVTAHEKAMPVNYEFMQALVGDVEKARAETYDHQRHWAGVHWQNCPGADKARRRRR